MVTKIHVTQQEKTELAYVHKIHLFTLLHFCYFLCKLQLQFLYIVGYSELCPKFVSFYSEFLLKSLCYGQFFSFMLITSLLFSISSELLSTFSYIHYKNTAHKNFPHTPQHCFKGLGHLLLSNHQRSMHPAQYWR